MATFMLFLALPRPISAEEASFQDLPKGATIFLPKKSAAEWPLLPGTLKKLDNTQLAFGVAGSPEKTYFATGRAIFILKKGAPEAEPIYVHEAEDIRDLIYHPDVGLFFTTANGAGYIGEKEQFVFLAYPDVELRLRGKALYIRLGSVANGILRVTGPEHFADLRLDPKK